MKKCMLCNKKIKVFRKKMCNNCYRKEILGHSCLDCNIKIYSIARRCYSCSRKELKGKPLIKNQGKNNGNYNGGKKTRNDGYIEILVKPDIYRMEHRMVMEEFLRRKLTNEEEIHHINGKKDDNRLINLRLFINSSEHIKYHWNTKWKERRKQI